LRRSTAGLILVVVLAFASRTLADEYPSRSIRFLQGFAPGGNADIISRIVGEELQQGLGQTIVYESRPGAAGNIASEAVVRSEPDGYTLLLLTTGHPISAALYKSLKFDPVKDFTFISTVTRVPYFFVVNANSRFATMVELVKEARTKPQAVTFGTAGVGTGQHLTGELTASAVGAKMLHVPFRGDSGAVTALLSESVDLVIAPGTAIFGNLAAGKFRALGVSGRQRWQPLPDVPTIAETVAPGFEVMGWIGVATVRGVPKPIVDRLNAQVRRIVALPTVQKKLLDIGNIPQSSTSEEFTTLVAADIARFGGVIEKAGIPRQ